MAGIPTQAIDAHAQTTQYLSNQRDQVYQDIMDNILGISDLVSLTGDSRGETPLSVEVREAGLLEAQNKKQKLYNSIGSEGFAKYSNQLSDQLVAAISDRNEAAKIVQEKESVGFFDNPLEFIMNQLTLDDDYARLEGADTVAKSASVGLQQLNASMQQTAQTENEYAITRNTAAIDSKLNAIKAELDIKVLNARGQALQTNAQRIEALMRADGEVMDTQIKRYNLEAAAEQREFMRSQKADYDAERELRIQERKLKLQALEDMKLSNEQKANLVRNAMVATGVPAEVAAAQVSANSIERLLKEPGMVGKRYQTYYEMGASAQLDGTLKYGDSAIEAASTVDQLGIPVKNDVQKTLLQYTKDAMNSPTLAAVTDKKARISEAERVAQTIAESKRMVIDSKDMSNPYQAPALSILVDQKAVKESELFAKVIAPQIIGAGLKEANPEILVEHTVGALAAGKISLDGAVKGLNLLYGVAVDYNNANNKYKSFGYKNQNTYPVQLPGGITGVKMSKPIDLMAEVQLRKYLTLRTMTERGIMRNIDWNKLSGVGSDAVAPIIRGVE